MEVEWKLPLLYQTMRSTAQEPPEREERTVNGQKSSNGQNLSDGSEWEFLRT